MGCTVAVAPKLGEARVFSKGFVTVRGDVGEIRSRVCLDGGLVGCVLEQLG